MEVSKTLVLFTSSKEVTLAGLFSFYDCRCLMEILYAFPRICLLCLMICFSYCFHGQLRSTVAPYFGKRGTPYEAIADQNIQAAKKLFHHLWNGHSGTGIRKVPISGDTTRLPFAEGLSPLEKQLAYALLDLKKKKHHCVRATYLKMLSQ